jgi:SAM-dependent methyltransferase
MDESNKQQQIVNWFDKTYSQKGERYLRAVQAYSVFLEMIQLRQDDNLLDVACGLGRLLEAAKEYKSELSGVDISSVAVEKAKQRLPQADISVANAEQLPFNDGAFDAVTCLGSLERMINLDAVLQELIRVGVPDARYCFLVRNSNTLIWKWFKERLGMRNDEGHQGAKSLEEWQVVFAKNGFKVDATYHDQYPLQRRKKWLSLGLAKVDHKQVLVGNRAIGKSGKLIFVLSKAPL